MTGECIETLKRFFSNFEEEEPGGGRPYILYADQLDRYPDVVDSWLDPDVYVEIRFAAQAPGMQDRYSGIEGWWQFWRSWLAEWDAYRFSLSNWEEVGDSVVVDIVVEARGRLSGVPVDTSASQVWTLRGDRIVSLRQFPSRKRALAALGREAR